MRRVISRFFEHAAAGGPVIMFAVLAALLVRNSPWERAYGVLRELPVAAAVGGMIAPAAIYMLFNGGDELAMRGWAILTEVRAQVGGARDPRRGGVCAGRAGYAVLHWWAVPATGDAVSGAPTG